MAELGRIPTNSSVLGSVQLTKGQKKRDFLYGKKFKKKLQAVIFLVENYLQLINEEALFTLKCERSVPTADNAYPY